MIWRIVQLTGVIATIFGIIYELVSQAHFGFIFITAGSLIFALGTKYVYWRSIRYRDIVPPGIKYMPTTRKRKKYGN